MPKPFAYQEFLPEIWVLAAFIVAGLFSLIFQGHGGCALIIWLVMFIIAIAMGVRRQQKHNWTWS